ncbi:MAG: hypothetical protein QM783_14020 [Phycisphaerales bacterium]
MSHRFLRRAGLTINPLVFLLLLVLIGIFVWRGWTMLDQLELRRPDIAQSARLTGVLLGCTLGIVIVLAVAGAIGAGTYFAAGRSDGATNAAMSLVLLLGCGWFAYQTYLMATLPPPAPTNTATTPPTFLQPRPLRNEAMELMEAQKAAVRQQMDALRQGQTLTPPSTNNPTRVPQPTPSGAKPPETTPTSTPAPTRAPSQTEIDEAKAAEKALAPLREEVRTTIDAFLAEAGPLVTSLGSTPRALRSELEGRVKSTSALKGKAADLEAYFRGLDAKAEAALKAGGLDFGGQIRQKVAFSHSSGAFEAANAAAVYQRLFDAAIEEAQALKDNAGKWRYDAGNQVTSTDKSLQMRLRRLHEVVGQHLRSIPESESTLKRTKPVGTPKP